MIEKMKLRKIKAVKEKEQEMMKKYGWVVHYVYEHDKELNGLANIHTHGIKEHLGHRDLQVVLPLDQKTVHGVLVGIVEDIKKGRIFEPEAKTPDVLRGFDVYFRVYQEGGREVLRLFLPDPTGKFPFDEGCDEIYKRQLETLPS